MCAYWPNIKQIKMIKSYSVIVTDQNHNFSCSKYFMFMLLYHWYCQARQNWMIEKLKIQQGVLKLLWTLLPKLCDGPFPIHPLKSSHSGMYEIKSIRANQSSNICFLITGQVLDNIIIWLSFAFTK